MLLPVLASVYKYGFYLFIFHFRENYSVVLSMLLIYAKYSSIKLSIRQKIFEVSTIHLFMKGKCSDTLVFWGCYIYRAPSDSPGIIYGYPESP